MAPKQGIKPLVRTAAVFLIAVISLFWGARVLLEYQLEPGIQEHAEERWPASSGLLRQPGRPAIVLFAHPECNCTEATIGELERVVAQLRPSPFISAVLVGSGTGSYVSNRLRERITSVPGVRLVPDLDGREAQIFHARTSGEIFAYDPNGRLLFHGGITGARGHAGANRGEDDLIAALRGAIPAMHNDPVFGAPCSLTDCLASTGRKRAGDCNGFPGAGPNQPEN